MFILKIDDRTFLWIYREIPFQKTILCQPSYKGIGLRRHRCTRTMSHELQNYIAAPDESNFQLLRLAGPIFGRYGGENQRFLTNTKSRSNRQGKADSKTSTSANKELSINNKSLTKSLLVDNECTTIQRV